MNVTHGRCVLIWQIKKGIDMKKKDIKLILVASSLVVLFIGMSVKMDDWASSQREFSYVDIESWDVVDQETHDIYLSIPDIVYENIVLLLDDNYTEYDVVEYYNSHRAWADSIQIQDSENI